MSPPTVYTLGVEQAPFPLRFNKKNGSHKNEPLKTLQKKYFVFTLQVSRY